MTKEEKRIIAITNKFGGEIDEVVFAAFRYYLGRVTIAADFFAKHLARAYPLLNDRYRALIKREINEAFEYDDRDRAENPEKEWCYLGWRCDREAWELVRNVANGEDKQEAKSK